MTTSLSDYYSQLEQFDWFYAMSDDNSVWRRGSAKNAELLETAKESPEHKKLYDDYKAHMWSEWHTKPDGSYDYDKGRKIPKPAVPQVKAFRTGESNGNDG